MAENYIKGVNKIWYRASGFASGKDIKVRLRRPNGVLLEDVSIPESIDEGIYNTDFDFDELGQWLGVFYEDTVKKTSSVFNINPKPQNMFVTYISKVL